MYLQVNHTSVKYRDRYRDEILRPLVRPHAGAVGPGFLLMQDNARPHVAGVCPVPARGRHWCYGLSPDLNPIEHIWDIMSRSIHQRHVAPQTVQELADALVQEHSQAFLIRSIPRHFREVIQAREGHTYYWASFWLFLRTLHHSWISL